MLQNDLIGFFICKMHYEEIKNQQKKGEVDIRWMFTKNYGYFCNPHRSSSLLLQYIMVIISWIPSKTETIYGISIISFWFYYFLKAKKGNKTGEGSLNSIVYKCVSYFLSEDGCRLWDFMRLEKRKQINRDPQKQKHDAGK